MENLKILKVIYIYLSVLGMFDLIVNSAEVDFTNKFSFASYYTDNMVLQGSPSKATIWGYGHPGSKVEVTISLKIYKTVVQGNGKWMVTVGPYDSENGLQIYTIRASHEEKKSQFSSETQTILLHNVLFGEVWICIEQNATRRNASFTMGQIENSIQEIRAASSYRNIRILNIKTTRSANELSDISDYHFRWSQLTSRILSSNGPDGVSAMCVLYATKLYEKIRKPIGIVHTTYESDDTQKWIPSDVTRICRYKTLTNGVEIVYSDRNYYWNGVINPLLNMTIKGVIWYQAEAWCQPDATTFECHFTNLISSWRRQAYESSNRTTDIQFSFGFVQMASYFVPRYGQCSNYMWGQTAGFGIVPNNQMKNVFMVSSYDLTEYERYTYKDSDGKSTQGGRYFVVFKKKILAERLFWKAMNLTYKYYGYPLHGPLGTLVFKKRNNSYQLKVVYNQQIRLEETKAFQFRCEYSDGTSEWRFGSAKQISAREINITAPPKCSYSQVGYFWKSYFCLRNPCGVHGTDRFQLPAPVYKWTFVNGQASRYTRSNGQRISGSNFLECLSFVMIFINSV